MRSKTLAWVGLAFGALYLAVGASGVWFGRDPVEAPSVEPGGGSGGSVFLNAVRAPAGIRFLVDSDSICAMLEGDGSVTVYDRKGAPVGEVRKGRFSGDAEASVLRLTDGIRGLVEAAKEEGR